MSVSVSEFHGQLGVVSRQKTRFKVHKVLSQDNSHDTVLHTHTQLSPQKKELYLTLERRGALLYREYARQHKYVFVCLLLLLCFVCFIFSFFLSMNMFVSYCVWLRFREISFNLMQPKVGEEVSAYMFNVYLCFLMFFFVVVTNLHITSCVSSTRHISGFLSCPS